ncbi:MAG TPA: glycosyltransferase family 87 protein [Candidatus Limnocylindrales bacterium]|nr:glycosyltransferase family 87 protein [Candidatus Limnocylindrales bacterium]
MKAAPLRLAASSGAWRSRLSPIQRRALRDGLWALAVVCLVAYLAGFVIPAWVGLDGHAYWQAWQAPAGLYAAPPASRDAYLYSPLFAQLIRPLALLPWPAFLTCWAILQAAVFAWLLRPLPARWFVVAYLACLPEVLEANINGLYALMIVLGFRWSASWAFALITKIAPGVGLLWFAARQEWRRLAAPLVLTAVLVALSALAWPAAWQAWVDLLLADSGGGGAKTAFLLPRLVVSAVLVVLGARLDRRWTVPLAVALASPVLFLDSFTVLAAIPRLRRAQPAAADQHPRPDPQLLPEAA